MRALRLTRLTHPRYRYMVTAPAKLFGKRLRKYFKVRADAEAYRATLLAELDSYRLAPLDREIHLIASRFQSEFTPAQFEATLSQAVAERTHANPPLGVLLDAHLAEQETAHQRNALSASFTANKHTYTHLYA